MQVKFITWLTVCFLSLMPMLNANALNDTPSTTSNGNVVAYTLDPNHSYVLWHVNHFGFSNPSGKWMANGTIQYDAKQPAKSSVAVTINVADIVTGIPALDKHLQTDTFFDVAKYPTATFVSDNIKITGKNSADVKGQLTVHGVTKPITLHMTLNKMGMSILTNKETMGLSGKAELSRAEFGMNAYEPGLGDKVSLEIEVEASPAN